MTMVAINPDDVKVAVDRMEGLLPTGEGGRVEVKHPKIFTDEAVDVQTILGQAVLAASYREFWGEVLGRARRYMSLVEGMAKAARHDYDAAVDATLTRDATKLINRSYSYEERRASAAVSHAEDRVRLRAVEIQFARARGVLAQIEQAHRAWRDTEFAIDRALRVWSFRHALGEM